VNKVEEFYKESGGVEYDKFDKKAEKFTYYDMIGFADAYYSKQFSVPKKEGKNKVLLDLQDIIEILSDEEIIFKSQIIYFGEDTNFECIEFTLAGNHYFSFDYYLDIDTHGHTIEGGVNQWFYSPKSKTEFLEFITTGHIKNK
jgi:hypothetical protein